MDHKDSDTPGTNMEQRILHKLQVCNPYGTIKLWLSMIKIGIQEY